MRSRLVKPARRRYHGSVTSSHPTGGAMSLAGHIEKLRTRHQSLETEIERENHKPHPDETALTGLKRKKLHIKDELVHLEHER
jgi:hypothetical protein